MKKNKTFCFFVFVFILNLTSTPLFSHAQILAYQNTVIDAERHVKHEETLNSGVFNNEKLTNETHDNSCGAVVMPDKMNVFYIGVDNPVTIGSSTIWDKTTLSMTNGTISGNGSVRTVRVSKIGKATITVVADNKPTTFEFRVKKIPDPIFKIGSGKNRMSAVEFKSQAYCRAEIENFDFDVSYKIISADVFFSGANFPSVIKSEIQDNSLSNLNEIIARCGPGCSISFENIKVKGPDGVRTIKGETIALY